MLLQGDCLDVLWQLETNSVDSLVTDPPAGISFMGKDWDDDKGGRDHWIKWMSEVMAECLRVLKPGAHALVWSIPRTSHWTTTAIENAGFEIRDVVTHLFGSGFPKSLDVSKAIDKANGITEWKESNPNPAFRKNQLEHNAKWDTRPRPPKPVVESDDAKQWQGFGTALKPAAEFWILARKPLSEKTVAKNVLKWGCGALNIDASRIPGITSGSGKVATKGLYELGHKDAPRKGVPNITSDNGRFPANLIFSCSEHCTDDQHDIECAIKMLDEQSGPKCGAAAPVKKKFVPISTNIDNYKPHTQVGDDGASFRNDSGGASRFFYCAKVSSRERNAGLEGMPEKQAGTLAQDKWSQENFGTAGTGRMRTNHHPTVKSKKLMSYLIKLITPPNGTILDPFMGSGSTGLAAKECGFEFIGIEREQEYFEIAEKRIEQQIGV